jgi:hypothetical protein
LLASGTVTESMINAMNLSFFETDVT